MGSFFRGLLCGMGIGFIIAPIRGQEMRRLVSGRLQTLRESVPDTEQLQQHGQQISDRTAQDASAFKSVPAQARVQVKKTTSKGGNVTQLAHSRNKQVEIDADEATEPSPPPMQEAVQMPPSSSVSASHDTDSTGETSASNDSLRTIPGMEPEVQRGLEEQGIDTIIQLLEQTTTKESRTDLAQKAAITTHQLRTLVDRADLMRLQGIGGDRATLLEEAGVAGCKDLQHRNPEHLHATLTDWYKNGMAASPLPTLDQVTQWIAEAKVMTAIAQREE
jgi:predicted flap endonuclease-1-like 5' DNA nuclease